MKMIRSPVLTRRTSRKPSADSGVVSRDQETLNSETNLGGQGPSGDNSAGDNSDGVFSDNGPSPCEVLATQGRSKIQKLDGNVYKPWGSRSRPSSVGSDASFCKGGPGKTCGEPVRSSENGVSCDKCEKWFHASCQGIPKPAYDALTKYKVLSWLCPACKESLRNPDPATSMTDLASLESKVDHLALKVDTHMKRIAQSLKEQEQAVDSQTKMIERSIRDNHTQKATYAEMVKGTCSDVVAKVSAKVSTIPQAFSSQAASKDMQTISRVFDDFLEKDKRKNNLVVHNLPETENSSPTERTEKDTKLFQEMVRETFHINASVSKVFRVGKVMQDKPRLLIVTLATPGVKGDILRLAPQLRNTENWSNIYITPDLTKTEREAARKVREELAARRAAGEANLIIRKGRVVIASQAASHGATGRPRDEPSKVGTQTPIPPAANLPRGEQAPLAQVTRPSVIEGPDAASIQVRHDA